MNGAEVILRTLADNGVEACFSNPGTSEMQKDPGLPSVNYRNCSRDSGEAPCVEMKVRDWDFRFAMRLQLLTSGSSPHAAPDVERSSYSPSA
jgi:hypothetical protein